MKKAKFGHLCVLLDALTPRHRSARLGVELLLGEPEPRVSALSGPPKRSSAFPRRACKSCLGSSLLLIITIFHWINEDPNK